MQHLSVAGESLLIGDEVADCLVRYAAHLGRTGGADDVAVRALGVDGEEVRLHLLLNAGVTLVAESTESLLPEPDNAEALASMRTRISAFELPDQDF
ncbi:hypothetical protein [Amnibacterium kyonggiense]|uniref:Uncharacterized protein n=1 Tax=Amnibacterium kyonggiense TaxID=595671 RepID=A0A4R7FQI4_9MICO|nr:hypothetical protein [Amnibacterium kyonggiense]TDS80041.1 hypothetical protein CLV52_0594 [Amnibacterium kyonggiense]